MNGSNLLSDWHYSVRYALLAVGFLSLVAWALIAAGCSVSEQTGAADGVPVAELRVSEPEIVDPANIPVLPDLFSGPVGRNSAMSGGEHRVPSVATVLEYGLGTAGLSPTHIVVRGSANQDSVRCDWRGIARSPDQRAGAIRFWYGLDETDPLPSAEEAEREFMAEIDRLNPVYPETVKANFRSLARGGLTEDYAYLVCYADYTIDEYILGAGPTTITVAYDRLDEVRNYELYQTAQAAGELGGESLRTPASYQQYRNEVAASTEALMGIVLEDIESVLFLAPMGAHNTIAIEAWQVVSQWQVTRDDSGNVLAFRFGASEDDPEYSQDLATLQSVVTTNAASDSHAGQRIANTSGLNQYYRDMGAYDDITPDDGEDTGFIPSQPPPIPACATGTAVSNTSSDRGLMLDCSALLAGLPKLRGTGTSLNWSNNVAITDWTGVSLSQTTPQRVVGLNLERSSLQGTIPGEFTRLTALGVLDLANNALTGEIPAWLADLPLSTLKLSGNQFTGCIPEVLRDIPTHDLDRVGLLYCDSMAPAMVGDLSASAVYDTWLKLAWTAPASMGSPISSYRLQSKLGDGEFEDVASEIDGQGTGYAVMELVPNTRYTFRLAAVNASGQGAWSNPVSTTTSAGSPDQVTEFSAETRGETSIILRWQAPRANGSEITGYMIQRRTPSTRFVDIVTAPVSESLEYADTGLDRNSEYIYRIKAVNEIGPSSSWSLGKNSRTALLAPPGVSSLSASQNGSASIAIYWKPGIGDNTVYHYEIQRLTDTGGFTDVATVDGSVGGYADTGLAPDTTYTYRIRATNFVGESAWSDTVSATTLSIPIFAQRSYSFQVYGGSVVGTSVGSVSAIPRTGSSVTYRIVDGSTGKFAIDQTTGLISTTDALLDYDTVSARQLTVEARDPSRGRDSVTVTVSLVAPCTDGITIVDHESKALRVSDCKVLLAVRDTLRGTGTLNWSGGLNMGQWDGIEFEANVKGVYALNLPSKGLNGVVSAGLSGLSQVDHIKLEGNQLTGSIPKELADLTWLSTLYLNDNQLSGAIPKELGSAWRLYDVRLHNNQLNNPIPKELGKLGNLAILILSNNQLSGSLPVELGNLSSLIHFRATNNSLTGSIPAELANPPNLTHLYLSGNSFTGCLPRAVAAIEYTDVVTMQLCAE